MAVGGGSRIDLKKPVAFVRFLNELDADKESSSQASTSYTSRPEHGPAHSRRTASVAQPRQLGIAPVVCTDSVYHVRTSRK